MEKAIRSGEYPVIRTDGELATHYCRNIIEKCNGEIVYRKSYALGGASFTVSLPERGNL